MMAATTSTSMYVKGLKSGRQGRPEVDVILIALFLQLDLCIYYISETGLAKQEFSFALKGQPDRQRIKLYLSADGGFDTVYEKSFIKSAGLCQSILLEVSFLIVSHAL